MLLARVYAVFRQPGRTHRAYVDAAIASTYKSPQDDESDHEHHQPTDGNPECGHTLLPLMTGTVRNRCISIASAFRQSCDPVVIVAAVRRWRTVATGHRRRRSKQSLDRRSLTQVCTRVPATDPPKSTERVKKAADSNRDRCAPRGESGYRIR
jgi:hypothetical protein